MVKTSPSKAGDSSSTPGQGLKIPHALRQKNQIIKQKQYCNKFNKDYKNGPHQKLFKKLFLKIMHVIIYEVAQLCPTLCDPVNCSPPSSSVHGIFQARVLEWVAVSFSRCNNI